MDIISTTPFGRRPVTAGLVQQAAAMHRPAPLCEIDKWIIFHELCTARKFYELSDRDLAVLNALLSFHPDRMLTEDATLIVFPSNQSLSTRAHGMAESTLRRHLAALVEAGVIRRHDSPNGKRYARRNSSGAVSRAFGFDLRPLLQQADSITAAAAQTRADAEALREAKEQLTLIKRDALKLAFYGQDNGLPGDWANLNAELLEIHKTSRRKLGLDALQELIARTATVLAKINATLTTETEIVSGSDSENERHYQSSKKETLDSEQSQENKPAQPTDDSKPQTRPNLPLELVAKACPDILPYCDDQMRHWTDLIHAADRIRAMMGVDQSTWAEAKSQMGAEQSAVTLACMLQRFTDIKNPGGYLRSLTKKSMNSQFSPAPMVMALLRVH